MRNYYSILEIDRSSDELDKLDRIAEVKPSLDEEYFDDLKTVLSDGEQSMHYRRMHLQYDAIAAVISRGTPQKDTNSWNKRIVEFFPEPNELPE